jgi:hypothetical protein
VDRMVWRLVSLWVLIGDTPLSSSAHSHFAPVPSIVILGRERERSERGRVERCVQAWDGTMLQAGYMPPCLPASTVGWLLQFMVACAK